MHIIGWYISNACKLSLRKLFFCVIAPLIFLPVACRLFVRHKRTYMQGEWGGASRPTPPTTLLEVSKLNTLDKHVEALASQHIGDRD